MPEIKFFPETHVAFVSEIGPYDVSIRRGFDRLFRWLKRNHIDPAEPSLAIFYDDPSKVAQANLHCDLCAPVGPEVAGSDDVRTKEIGGWRVATTTYRGEDNASQAYDQVYQWLRAEGYHEADAPVEKYLSPVGKEIHAEIAVPIIEKRFMPGNLKTRQAKDSETAKATTATKKPAARTIPSARKTPTASKAPAKRASKKKTTTTKPKQVSGRKS